MAAVGPLVRGLASVVVLCVLLAAPAFYRVQPPTGSAPSPPPAAAAAPSPAPIPAPEAAEPLHPPVGHLPAGLWQLAPSHRHVIAVDASRSRLYLLERTDGQWRLAADHPVSLGRAGIAKRREGDARTPLGLYHITSRLTGPGLDPFYGPGALTLDYPNRLDRAQGRTGSRIWIHGSAAGQAPRPPRDTDGCVVLPNGALQDLIARVALRTTPVLIAAELDWLAPDELAAQRAAFEPAWAAWREARRRAHGRALEFKDLSLLAWPDGQPVVQVTFGEVPRGQRAGVTRRQHWRLEQGQWRLFDQSIL